MELDDIFMHYELYIRACNKCERYIIEAADADVMRNLYWAFCDSFQNEDNKKEQIYNKKCTQVVKYLITAIRKSPFPEKTQEDLIGQLKGADFFTIFMCWVK